MKLSIEDIPQEERNILSPCGIACLGCDIHHGESLKAA